MANEDDGVAAARVVLYTVVAQPVWCSKDEVIGISAGFAGSNGIERSHAIEC